MENNPNSPNGLTERSLREMIATDADEVEQELLTFQNYLAKQVARDVDFDDEPEAIAFSIGATLRDISAVYKVPSRYLEAAVHFNLGALITAWSETKEGKVHKVHLYTFLAAVRDQYTKTVPASRIVVAQMKMAEVMACFRRSSGTPTTAKDIYDAMDKVIPSILKTVINTYLSEVPSQRDYALNHVSMLDANVRKCIREIVDIWFQDFTESRG